MPRWYVDTSAALRLLLEEAGSPELARAIDGSRVGLVSGRHLELELRHAARRSADLDQYLVTQLLAGIDLADPPAGAWHVAGVLPGDRLGPSRALHLTMAILLEADALVTYDPRTARAAHGLGVVVVQPSPAGGAPAAGAAAPGPAG